MSVQVSWGDAEESILVWKFEGEWSADQFLLALAEARDMTASKLHIVDVMVDMRRALRTPASMMTHARTAMKQMPDNIGKTVVIGSSNIWAKIYGTMIQEYRNQHPDVLEFVDAVDKAYTCIEEARRKRINRD